MTAKLIYSSTLGAAGTFDVQNISQKYKSLVIRLYVRSEKPASDNDGIYIFFNNDTTATNYRSQNVYNTTAAGSDTSLFGVAPGATALANAWGAYEITIPAYATTTANKEAHVFGHERRAAATSYVWRSGVEWENTAAINRITFATAATANFIAGSQIEVYGYS